MNHLGPGKDRLPWKDPHHYKVLPWWHEENSGLWPIQYQKRREAKPCFSPCPIRYLRRGSTESWLWLCYGRCLPPHKVWQNAIQLFKTKSQWQIKCHRDFKSCLLLMLLPYSQSRLWSSWWIASARHVNISLIFWTHYQSEDDTSCEIWCGITIRYHEIWLWTERFAWTLTSTDVVNQSTKTPESTSCCQILQFLWLYRNVELRIFKVCLNVAAELIKSGACLPIHWSVWFMNLLYFF